MLYLWNLSASGYGNTFYAAAAQAGSQSWSAWFFGSLDAQNFITVDKPPASLWVTGLSVRLFGMNSWAVLAPQALMGVAAVAVLYCAVRRAFADPDQRCGRGLLAGAVLAVTPGCGVDVPLQQSRRAAGAVADGGRLLPDARGVRRIVALAGARRRRDGRRVSDQDAAGLPGAARLRSCLPACCADVWRKRVLHLLGAAARADRVGGLVGAGGAADPGERAALHRRVDRQHRAGSGVRLQRDRAASSAAIGKDTPLGDWGGSNLPMLRRTHRRCTGCSPARWATRSRGCCRWRCSSSRSGCTWPRGGRSSRDEKGALMMWGAWLVVTGVVFSFMGGMVHPYYTVALAPAVAALVGIGAVWAWRRTVRAGMAAARWPR